MSHPESRSLPTNLPTSQPPRGWGGGLTYRTATFQGAESFDLQGGHAKNEKNILQPKRRKFTPLEQKFRC